MAFFFERFPPTSDLLPLRGNIFVFTSDAGSFHCKKVSQEKAIAFEDEQ
jgi:hypothetical protein